MSDEPKPGAAADAELGSLGSGDFEPWLRKAARAPSLPRPGALPRPGQVISGKYRIEAELGRGGMGAVFRARHVISEKPVALKWMLRPLSEPATRRRYTREARALGRIDHPNVVDVYDIGEDGEGGYLVMELLRGESLRERVARGPLAVAEAVDLLIPAMHGVSTAHRVGVIHRDLKPDNVFLCDAGGGVPQAKVLDFGVSTITGPRETVQTTLTRDGMVVGTPAYMPKEQLEHPGEIDERADVYALGVVLYHAVTGKLPFDADSYNALVLAIANRAPTPPSRYRPDLPVGFETVVLRAIAKQPEDRFANVEAFIAALGPFGSTSRSDTSEPASREGVATPAATRPAGTRAIWLLAILVTGMLGWLLLWEPEAPRARVSTADDRPERSVAAATAGATAETRVPRPTPEPAHRRASAESAPSPPVSNGAWAADQGPGQRPAPEDEPPEARNPKSGDTPGPRASGDAWASGGGRVPQPASEDGRARQRVRTIKPSRTDRGAHERSRASRQPEPTQAAGTARSGSISLDDL